MTTMKMIAKALLMICCAPVVMIGILFAIYGAMVAGIVGLIRGNKKGNEAVSEQISEASAQLIAENSKMLPTVTQATV